MWAKDVVARGAGPVVKNTAARTMILPRATVCRRRKTITILFVAARRLDSRRRTIVEVGIQGIVRSDGKSKSLLEWVAITNPRPILQEEPETELVSSAEDLSRVSWVVL